MNRLIRSACTALAVALLFAGRAPVAQAQFAPELIRLFRPFHQVAIAQLPEVEKELKLTDAQKAKARELNDSYNEDRLSLFQDAQGDFDSIADDMAKLNAETAKKFNETMDEGQQKRLAEIFVQANGAASTQDADVAAALKLTDEQKKKLQDLRAEFRQSMFSGGTDWQGMSSEERIKEIDKMVDEQDKGYIGVLTDEQKASFEKMQGKKLEMDLYKLPNPFAQR